MDSNSMSDYSQITEFQTPPRSRPGRPTVLKRNMDSLTVSWLRAEADGDSPVLHYMVEYMEAGLEGWQFILTEGPECECTITHPYSTCYRVRVSAVYEEGDTSKPSEETEVPLDVWIIDVSERTASLFLEVLKLQTVKKPVELTGWPDEESEVRSFLQCLPYISQLRLSGGIVHRMVQAQRAPASTELTIEELSLVQNCTRWPEEELSRVLSSLSSLLLLWNDQCLNLTEQMMEVQSLTALLCHHNLLTVRLSKESLQKLFVMVNEAQDEELTCGFLQEVGGDLTSCSLNWEMIHHFLQYHTVTGL
ncbi:uncharacterized protein LOC108416895 [Pygocentrus nattereri]|uniref:uncharacterized protein LOC108416895 n=1 Tax=Pygocentrus nattereri TaxID=42514 RepID=UPI00189122AB|nr:uncharacterized protein LOC108416895 [Pygocentrus nattereri]